MESFSQYDASTFFDEFITTQGEWRPEVLPLIAQLNQMGMEKLSQRQWLAEKAFLKMGITFKDRIFPFDIIPRLITSVEWKILERGLKQRIEALNLFIGDIYNAKKILKDKVIPEEIIYSSTGYLRACEGIKPAKNIWTHVSGIDLIRHEDGRYYVLEDNLRVPSGVSYVLGNREICKNSFSQSLENMGVKPVADYPMKLKSMLKYCAENVDASVVVLTPGIHNSAYFEHSFLAKQMGVPLVEGRDLTIFQNKVFMRTTKGFEKADVIYRRIDDTFLDPFEFNPDSVLGVPGLFQAFSKGNVVLANAPGTGVADDKAVYAYVPEMIKYYLNEEPILNNVPTHLCWKEKDKQYVIEHLEELVVKPVSESGGYGLLIGPQSSASERDLIKEKIIKSPRNFIAQPTLKLSTVPTLIDHKVEARHVDLRPYIIYGEKIHILPGGLTRVALKKGSLVVNSSQGGGSKDTWVLA